MKFENTKFGEYERVTDTHIYFWKVLCQKELARSKSIRKSYYRSF